MYFEINRLRNRIKITMAQQKNVDTLGMAKPKSTVDLAALD